MTTRLATLWEKIRTSFLFVPFGMVLLSIILSLAVITFDTAVADQIIDEPGWVYTGGPEGARAVLSTIAGSVITVAGVIFSITIAVLTLATSQFGPRLLRNFVRDTANQVVLGTFIATFIYCLLVLRTVRGTDESQFVPQIAVTIGVALAVLSMCMLIFFIHHTTTSIQAEHVINSVGNDLDKAIDRLFPDPLGEEPSDQLSKQEQKRVAGLFEQSSQSIVASKTGYIQAIDSDALMNIAISHNLIIQLVFRPGQYVIRDGELARVYPSEMVDDQLADKINSTIILGALRTQVQDAKFVLNQLVEIAVRALSPSTNDPFTAITCIDRLGAALSQLASRAFPSAYRCDDDGHLRVMAGPIEFVDFLNAAFNQIRQNSASNAAVTIRLLETLTVIAAYTRNQEQRAALLRQANMIARGSRKSLLEEEDQRNVAESFRHVVQAIDRSAASQTERENSAGSAWLKL